MPDVQLRGVLRAGQLRSELLIAVVEDELVEPRTAELLALVAGQRRRIALPAGVDLAGAGAMPGRAAAAAGVGLAGGAVVGGAGKDGRIAGGAAGGLPTRGAGDAAFAAAVVCRRCADAAEVKAMRMRPQRSMWIALAP
jgi:hypothetical protein